MNTINIDNSLYNSTIQYAQQHNMNINQVVEAGLKLLLSQISPKHEKAKSVWETGEYKDAMAYLDTLSDSRGNNIPADEDGREARTEKYEL